MNVKKIKRKCSVRGCKNIDTFAVSRTREMGGSVIICKDCLKDALKAAEEYKEPPKDRKKLSGAPPLFFADILKGNAQSVKTAKENSEPEKQIAEDGKKVSDENKAEKAKVAKVKKSSQSEDESHKNTIENN